MTSTLKSVFSRVLSEEIGKQEKWKNNDEDNGFDASHRDEVVKEIQQFMRDNEIDFRTDYYFEGRNN